MKDVLIKKLEDQYLKRITQPKLFLHETKASSENKEQEGNFIIQKLNELNSKGSGIHIALSEHGKMFDSMTFANNIEKYLNSYSRVIFIISGAEGFSQNVLDLCDQKIALSAMTFPHRIARLVLIEQIYRSETLRRGHPYHN